MPNHSAKAIANEFLKRRASPFFPAQMQLQKLVYIAHGWNLAINGEPLVLEPAQAWDNGPVYRSIWNHIRDFGYGPNCTLVDQNSKDEISESLSVQETAVVDHVWGKYGDLSASELSNRTHEPNSPWSEAYFSRGRNANLNNEIIKKYYIELALAGRHKQ